MLEFHKVTAGDGQWARPLLMESGYRTCEYAFTDIFMWSILYGACIARHGNFVTVRSRVGDTCQYLFPGGTGTPAEEKEAVQAILDDAASRGCRPYFYGVPDMAKEHLEAHFPGMFQFTDQRDYYDYLYSAQELAELPGKKFQKKRNHVSRFLRENPDWAFHEILPEDLPAIRAFAETWYNEYDGGEESGIDRERKAVEWVFDHYSELGLCGGYLTAGGRIVAISYGSAINAQVFDTQVEKALHSVNGAYAMINREMARHYGSAFEYINREDDTGAEGLRKAKLSYNPAVLERKWLAELAD